MINPALNELVAAARSIEVEIATFRATGASAGGHVDIEVDARGRITRLHITDAAVHLGASALAAAISEAQHIALDSAAARAHELRVPLHDDPQTIRLLDHVGAPLPPGSDSLRNQIPGGSIFNDPLGRRR